MDEFVSFINNYPIKTYEPGEVIIHQNEPCKFAYVITDGLIKTYDINKEGEIKPLSYDGLHQVFPMATIYSFSKYTLYYFEAYLDTSVSIIPKKEFIEFIENHPDSLFYIHHKLVQAYLDNRRRINSLSQIRAEEKILYALDYLCRRFGNKINPDKIEVSIPISQQELANFLGLTRETVSTNMNQLRKLGIIDYKDMNHIRVNIPKLNQSVNS